MYRFAPVLLVLFAALPLLAAEPTRRDSAGIEFVLPKNWKVSDEKGELTFQMVKGNVVIAMRELKEVNANELKKLKTKVGVVKFLEKIDLLKDVEIDDDGAGDEEKVNGLNHTDFSGDAAYKKGDRKDKETEWFVTFVEGAKVPLLFYGVGDIAEHETAIDELFEAIHKIGAAKGKKKR